MIVLDTDTLSLFHVGHERITQRIAKVEADETLATTVITKADILRGRCSFVFDELCERKKLKKIGRADLLIAAVVLANDATRITRNLRHFRQIPSLAVENWAD